MPTLANTLKQNKPLVRGPGGQLSEQTPEEIQSLADKAGLQAPPITPIGAAAIGANADQQKMAGSPAQKQAALTIAQGPAGTLQDALRRKQVRSTATSAEQASMQKSENLQNLGSLGDRVNDFINNQRQVLAESATAPIEVKAAEQYQGRDLAGAKDVLARYRANPSDINLAKEVNKALGRAPESLLDPKEVDQLYEDATSSIARGAAGTVDDNLNVDDLVQMKDFGYDKNTLADLLGVDPAAIGTMSVGQIKSQLDKVSNEEFSKTVELEQKASSGQLGAAERGLAREAARESSMTGTRASEADIQNLESQISSADEVSFAGKIFKVEDLLKDDTISGIIKEYMDSGPDSEIRRAVDSSEPALRQFILKNQEALADVSRRMGESTGQLQQIQQEKEKHIQASGIDRNLLRQFVPDLDQISTESVDFGKIPVFQAMDGMTPEQRSAYSDSINRDPELAATIKDMPADQIKNLGIGQPGGRYEAVQKNKATASQISAIDPAAPDSLDKMIMMTVPGVANVAELMQKYRDAQIAVDMGKASPQDAKLPNILDSNNDGKLDSPEVLKESLLKAVPTTGLQEAAKKPVDLFQGVKVNFPEAAKGPEKDVLNKLYNVSPNGLMNYQNIYNADMGLDDLLILKKLQPGNSDVNLRYSELALNNTNNELKSIDEKAAGDLGNQINALENLYNSSKNTPEGKAKLNESRVWEELQYRYKQREDRERDEAESRENKRYQRTGNQLKRNLVTPLEKAGGSIGKALRSDETTKEEISKVSNNDINEFLDAADLYEYKYKPRFVRNKEERGKKLGFMMQDVDNTKVGKIISRDVDGKKGYDPQSLQMVLLEAVKRK